MHPAGRMGPGGWSSPTAGRSEPAPRSCPSLRRSTCRCVPARRCWLASSTVPRRRGAGGTGPPRPRRWGRAAPSAATSTIGPSRSRASDSGYTPRCMRAPPPRAGSNMLWPGSTTTGAQKLASKHLISPIASCPSRRRSSATRGRKRVHIPSMQKTLAARAASAISSASAPFMAKGFSTSTGRAAAMAARAWSRCADGGVATYTASTPSAPMASSYEPATAGMSRSAAMRVAFARSLDATMAAWPAYGDWPRPSTNFRATAPVPRMAHRNGASSPRGSSCITEPRRFLGDSAASLHSTRRDAATAPPRCRGRCADLAAQG